MANLQGAEALVNDFETQWQVRYNIAAAAAAKAREQRRAAACLADALPSSPSDSSLKQAQDLNRVAVAAATEQRAAASSARHFHAGMSCDTSGIRSELCYAIKSRLMLWIDTVYGWTPTKYQANPSSY